MTQTEIEKLLRRFAKQAHVSVVIAKAIEDVLDELAALRSERSPEEWDKRAEDFTHWLVRTGPYGMTGVADEAWQRERSDIKARLVALGAPPRPPSLSEAMKACAEEYIRREFPKAVGLDSGGLTEAGIRKQVEALGEDFTRHVSAHLSGLEGLLRECRDVLVKAHAMLEAQPMGTETEALCKLTIARIRAALKDNKAPTTEEKNDG